MEARLRLVWIQTFLLYYVNQVILMLTSIFQEQFPQQSKEGLYQNKVTLTLASIHNCKMAYWCYILFVWHCKFHSSILYFVMYLHILLCIVFCYPNMTF